MKSHRRAILFVHPSSGPDAAGAAPEASEVRRAWLAAATLPVPGLAAGRRPYTGRRDPLPRTSVRGRPDRRRRRHGDADRSRGGEGPARAGGGESRLARDRRLGPRRLHRGGRGGDRDEHVRRQPLQAGAARPRRRGGADQPGGRADRARGGEGPEATASSPARSGRSATAPWSPTAPAPTPSRPRGCRGRRRPVPAGDVPRSTRRRRRSRPCAPRPRSRVALLTFNEDGRRSHGDTPEEAARAGGARRRRRRRQPQPGPAGCADRSRGWPARSRSRPCRTRASAARGTRLVYPHAPSTWPLRRAAREVGARVVGGCCGTTPAHIRTCPLGADVPAGARRGEPVLAAAAEGGPGSRPARGEVAPRPRSCARQVRGLGRARPAAGRTRGGIIERGAATARRTRSTRSTWPTARAPRRA